MMEGTTLLALSISSALIFWLSLGDPKRRRAEKLAGPGHGTSQRRMLAVGVLLPGITLAAVGDAAAFLIWLGGCAVIGWLIAILMSRLARQAGD